MVFYYHCFDDADANVVVFVVVVGGVICGVVVCDLSLFLFRLLLVLKRDNDN